MTIRLSKPIIFGVSVFILVLVGGVVWKRQVVESSTKMASPSATTVVTASPSPTATSKITYAFPIRNTVTKEQRQQFKNSKVGSVILNNEKRLSTIEELEYPKMNFSEFNDNEVAFLQIGNNKIITNIQDDLVVDPIERSHTIRTYAVSNFRNPLLRVSTSSFSDVVEYEKKQLFTGGYDKDNDNFYEVTAFGQKGIELERFTQGIYWNHTLIVPLNGFVYVFYVDKYTEPHIVNLIFGSIKLVDN